MPIKKKTHKFKNRKAADRARKTLLNEGHMANKVKKHPKATKWKYSVRASSKRVFASTK